LSTVVITGSTRGIGFGLAHAFLARGCQVTISGRTQEAVAEAVDRLAAEFGLKHLFGYPCDVTVYEQVQALWDAAKDHWGQIDIWINNAGIAHAQTQFGDQSPEEMAAVVQTNVLGSMYGAQVALRGMLGQGSGSLYNLEGLGSDGRKVEGLTTYGTTKHTLTYLTDALVEETKGTPVLVGALRPGMVVTDMLTQQYRDRPEDWERAKRVFNILADRVETVTPWFADQILANTKSGIRFRWLSRGRAMGRFLTAPFRKRDLFADDPTVPE
jgi:NAD(P)-dependent dehydrogenase (short-subunit alcohol dehydrogenase family)